jgi:hypothetical protein
MFSTLIMSGPPEFSGPRRPFDAAGDDDDNDSHSKRTERKRQREKQRRSDLSGAFVELGTLLGELETDWASSGVAGPQRSLSSPSPSVSGGSSHTATSLVAATAEGTASSPLATAASPPVASRKRSAEHRDSLTGDSDSGGTTRLDLVLRTIHALKTMKSQNESLRQSVRTLQQQRQQPQQQASEGGGDGSESQEVISLFPWRLECSTTNEFSCCLFLNAGSSVDTLAHIGARGCRRR